MLPVQSRLWQTYRQFGPDTTICRFRGFSPFGTGLLLFTRLPEISPNDDTHGAEAGSAVTGIGSFFINYTKEVKELHLNEMQGGLLLSMGNMALFVVGRFSGSFIM